MGSARADPFLSNGSLWSEASALAMPPTRSLRNISRSIAAMVVSHDGALVNMDELDELQKTT
jgi:hypothetical protein